MSWTTIEDSLYAATSAILPDTKVVIAYQNGAELVSPYCMIHVLNQDQVGREMVSWYCVGEPPNEVFTQEIQEVYEVLVRFHFVGKDGDGSNDASNLAHQFYSFLNNPEKRYNFALQNLAVMRKTSLIRVPDVRDTDIYNSYNVDVVFSYCLQLTETAEYFDSATISGDLTGSIIDPHQIDPFTIPS